MRIEEFKNKIRILIGNNKLNEAIEACYVQSTECYDASIKDQITVIKQKYNENQKNLMLDLVSQNDYNKIQDETISEIHDYLNQLEAFLTNNDVNTSGEAAYNLRKLVLSLRSSQLVLNNNQFFSQDLSSILNEIKKSYSVVIDQINSFSKPLLSQPLDFITYQEISTNGIHHILDNGRGKCHVIFNHYHASIRPLLEKHKNSDSEEFERIENVFNELSDGDRTIFMQLIEVGRFISKQAEEIIDEVINGNEPSAKLLILQGRKKLKELKNELDNGLLELTELEILLGHNL